MFDQTFPTHIPKSELVTGAYYQGMSRNSLIALWSGKKFVYLRYKFGGWISDEINHPEDDDGRYDVFIPIQLLLNPHV